MKKRVLTALLCLAFCPIGWAQGKVILDTDPSSDPDDVGYIAMLHAMASRGGCELLAVINSIDQKHSPLSISVINRDIDLNAKGVCLWSPTANREQGYIQKKLASEAIANEIEELMLAAFAKTASTSTNPMQLTQEIKAVLSGKAEGGLTWTQDPPLLFEDVTTNATERDKQPLENTWGALHEYHHVFQMAHCDTKQKRSSDKHINSWMAEGMATYSSAKFMENLGLIDFKSYMLQLRKSGGNIGRPGINEFLASAKEWRLDEESYWDDNGPSPQVYYMIGAWATAYLIHVEGVDEKTVLKDWYHDIPRIGKSASFAKHMGLSVAEFYKKFDQFIRKSDDDVMRIFNSNSTR